MASKRPRNESNLRKLAGYYKEVKDGMAHLRIFQEIGNLHPNDLTVQGEVRSALAFSTMHKANWEKEGSTYEKVKDKESAVAEQIAEGSLHDDKQAVMLIEKYTKELEENESSDVRRRLAEAYIMLKDYEKAIEQLNTIQEKNGTMDPAIDKLIESAYIANIDDNMAKLMAMLKNEGLEDNTILIFTTDNGTASGISKDGKKGFEGGMRGKGLFAGVEFV